MTRITGPECAVIMCNLINTHTRAHTEDQCEWHRMTRLTGPDCVVMSNLMNTHTHTHTACGHPTAPFAKPGPCTRASHRGGNRVRGTGRSEWGWGRDRSRGRERRWERSWRRERGRGRGRSGNGNGNGGGGERKHAFQYTWSRHATSVTSSALDSTKILSRPLIFGIIREIRSSTVLSV